MEGAGVRANQKTGEESQQTSLSLPQPPWVFVSQQTDYNDNTKGEKLNMIFSLIMNHIHTLPDQSVSDRFGNCTFTKFVS